jgi:hypothetical protein
MVNVIIVVKRVNTKEVESILFITTKMRQNPYFVQYVRKMVWLMQLLKSVHTKDAKHSLFIITKERQKPHFVEYIRKMVWLI